MVRVEAYLLKMVLRLRLSNSIVRNNESGSGEQGGGIHMDGGTRTMGYIHNTEIYNNFAFKNGGGIYADSPLYITNSIIRDNRCLRWWVMA